MKLDGLSGLRDATEAAEGRQTRVFGRQTLLDKLVRRLGEMAGDLVVHVAIHLPRTEECPRSQQEDAEAFHDASSEILKKRSTMPVARCH